MKLMDKTQKVLSNYNEENEKVQLNLVQLLELLASSCNNQNDKEKLLAY